METKPIYYIGKDDHTRERLFQILDEHPEIKFVSVAGIDLMGHETDEKIPVSLFREDIDLFLHKTAVQTDGSSVVLPGIATLNNAKIDMKVDVDAKWWVDYNHEHLDEATGKAVCTLKIPCFLIHDNKDVDSRSILRRATDHFETTLTQLLKDHPASLEKLGIHPNEVDRVEVTAATELEFWVMSPEEKRNLEELSASQELKEQYWSRTRGNVRTALEKTLIAMENFGVNPEMGHKEVGGVKSHPDSAGNLKGIMEQLEIDWKYSTTVQAADNEILVKHLVKENFRRKGMDVTFLAKPLEGVAGSGEHTHLGIMLHLKDGRKLNLFAGAKDDYMSRFGFGAVMGVLKNYEIMSPFIVQSNDAFRRLKKGYEAPICIVTSIGVSPEIPSRNRTILIGLIRDTGNPMATRFELRSPNAHTNTYLAITTMMMCMLDGLKFVIEKNKDEAFLLKEISKQPEESAEYLQTGRAYRSEEDVFDSFTDEERDRYFGLFPQTVFENVHNFDLHREKLNVLKAGDVLTDQLIESFRQAVTNKWGLEIYHRIIPSFSDEIRSMKKLHHPETASDMDLSNWMRVRDLRHELLKNTHRKPSIMTKLREALNKGDLGKASDLQIKMYAVMDELRKAYKEYQRNLMDV